MWANQLHCFFLRDVSRMVVIFWLKITNHFEFSRRKAPIDPLVFYQLQQCLCFVVQTANVFFVFPIYVIFTRYALHMVVQGFGPVLLIFFWEIFHIRRHKCLNDSGVTGSCFNSNSNRSLNDRCLQTCSSLLDYIKAPHWWSKVFIMNLMDGFKLLMNWVFRFLVVTFMITQYHEKEWRLLFY